MSSGPSVGEAVHSIGERNSRIPADAKSVRTFDGDGGDQRSGDEGNATLEGGSGTDKYIFEPGSGNDRAIGFKFAEGDRL